MSNHAQEHLIKLLTYRLWVLQEKTNQLGYLHEQIQNLRQEIFCMCAENQCMIDNMFVTKFNGTTTTTNHQSLLPWPNYEDNLD